MIPTVVNYPRFSYRLICHDWNNNRKPGCPHTDCSYQHIYNGYAFDPNVPDNAHRAVFCLYKQLLGQQEMDGTFHFKRYNYIPIISGKY